MDEGYGRIVATAFAIDAPDVTYAQLKQDLTFGFDATQADYGTMLNQLDRAEANAQLAAELLVNAKVTRQILEIDLDVFDGAMREKAVAQLNAEYQRKERRSPTIADIEGAIAMMFPDQYRASSRRRVEMKGTVEAIESLANRWNERARDLRVMVQTARGS